MNIISFTFQSGSIQILCLTLTFSPPYFFTFQSGSIQMKHKGEQKMKKFEVFTFQSGSIQMI